MNRHQRRTHEALARRAAGAGAAANDEKKLAAAREEQTRVENEARFSAWMEANKNAVDGACEAVVKGQLAATHACVIGEEDGQVQAYAKPLEELTKEALAQKSPWMAGAVARARAEGHLFVVVQPEGMPTFVMARVLLTDPRLPPKAFADPMRSTALDASTEAESNP